MQKIIFFISMIGVLMFLLIEGFIGFIGVIDDYAKYQQSQTVRNHLFCEVLKPGMSEDEALRALRQFGELHVVETYKQNPHALNVHLSDGKGGSLTGSSAILYFFGHKYDSAYITNFDKLEAICDFSRATQIAP